MKSIPEGGGAEFGQEGGGLLPLSTCASGKVEQLEKHPKVSCHTLLCTREYVCGAEGKKSVGKK